MFIKNEDTICAPATVPGTGAISVIRLSGPEALRIADKVVSCKAGRAEIGAEQAVATIGGESKTEKKNAMRITEMDAVGVIEGAKGYTLKFGTVFLEDGTALDEVLVSIFRAPHSYTGENSVEISCHASTFIVNNILRLLLAAGARMADAGEFTLRSYLNGKMDLAQAEAVADLISSQNAASHRVAFKQMKGGFSSELKEMRAELLHIVSLMELELDFSEEEVEFADRAQMNVLLEKVIAHIKRLADSFRLGNAIKNGISIAIVGATNAGKSTLLNTLLGEERAIVSDIHGTTRDTIEEVMTIDDVMYRFIDTAGIRETSEVVEKIGIERTFKKIAEAEIVIGVVDGSLLDSGMGIEDIREIVHKLMNGQNVIAELSSVPAAEPVNSDKSVLRENLSLGSAPLSEALLTIISCIDFDTQHLIIAVNKSDLLESAMVSGGHSEPVSGSGEATAAGHRHPLAVSQDECPLDSYLNSDLEGLQNIHKETVCHSLTVNSESATAPVILISAKVNSGIDKLRSAISAYSKEKFGDRDSTLVTNIRHYEALNDASTSLLRVKDGLAAGIPSDLVAQDIRESIYHLGSIVGEISSDEVLGNIFRNFCIGK